MAAASRVFFERPKRLRVLISDVISKRLRYEINSHLRRWGIEK
jgi:hypothetical protein